MIEVAVEANDDIQVANGPRRKSVRIFDLCGSLRAGESFTCHAAGNHFFVPVEEPWHEPRFFNGASPNHIPPSSYRIKQDRRVFFYHNGGINKLCVGRCTYERENKLKFLGRGVRKKVCRKISSFVPLPPPPPAASTLFLNFFRLNEKISYLRR